MNLDSATPEAFILSRIQVLCPRSISAEELLATPIDQSGIESLELMELLMEIEDAYNIQIPDTSIGEHMTVADLCGLTKTLLSASS